MDILTHTFSGMAVGTVLSSYSKRGFADRIKIILIAGFAAVLPDLDAISLWTGFDDTLGNFFNLSVSGKKIYSARLWYSHHGFMHSLVAGILFTGLLGLFSYLIQSRLKNLGFTQLIKSFKHQRLLLLAFILGFIVHLLEDMPTPASTWSGVNFFWPINSYIGGSGNIWWWNNYDIFLIVLSVLLINSILLIFKRLGSFKLFSLTLGVFAIGLLMALIQIKTRSCDFAYAGHTSRYHEFESKSKEIQKEILGKRIYILMEGFDKKLKIHF